MYKREILRDRLFKMITHLRDNESDRNGMLERTIV